ncbi:MAG: hypothetical protein ACXV8K_17910, partial [Ilumatobacteraceae bacterium]
VQTISLFTASFVILGLNSFVWGIVAGHRPLSDVNTTAPQAAESCQRVWSQAVVGVGMISLGAIAMVCNITSLFFWQRLDGLREKDRRYLRTFLLLVQAGAVLGVIAFVGSDSFNYLHVVYDGRIPLWFTALTLSVTLGGLLVALYVGTCHYFGRTAFAHSRTARSRMKDRMRIPTVLIVLYAVFGAVAVTVAGAVSALALGTVERNHRRLLASRRPISRRRGDHGCARDTAGETHGPRRSPGGSASES